MLTLPRRAGAAISRCSWRVPLALVADAARRGRRRRRRSRSSRATAPPSARLRPPGEPAAAAARPTSRTALRARALHGPAVRACRSSCRPTAPRCSSSSSTTTSARPAASPTWPTSRSSRSTRASNPGAVKVVLKDYPLNSECNANMTTMLHPAACDAAVAVRLARAAQRGRGARGVAVHATSRR